MLFLVEMEVRIPHDADPVVVEKLKAEEKAGAQELQRNGEWRHLWRVAGRYANVSVFDVDTVDRLHELLVRAAALPVPRHPRDAAGHPPVGDRDRI